ncbi:hypothetical protein JQV19_08585 [Sulfitobacter mediterraneus]|uniref:hypothetical protein n=1 Tax=Sulfitobacter mediterraneus TaxID=83219 RepID=UPI00193A0F7D|nr:hypothetical protein [Sulfitobacter mediterraneus]MBM1556703.1 hypothetical protein [Sulfitobacter mediterraneus]MBM1570100.1 hypothetical protein [Sulfitobacter mediterraneus]MBM1574057.1 hypothetical protein [Sulfitobacter mediterraneus]MBM1577842.1 hypothetical protein [Sulfitobacter mediterraneus]MBM1579661.1 hypothetical protein [Sulfitobacter mediterraneus]
MSEALTDTDTVERVAKAINGPRDAAHIGTLRLHELQDYKWVNQTTPQERVERLSAARAAIAALPPAVPDEADLDERMKAAGMIPLSEMLESHGPMEKWMRHADVHTFDDFCVWIKSKQKSFMTMRMQYELGDKDKDDEMWEWVFAHAAVFDGIAAQLRAITTPDPVAEAAKVERLIETTQWVRNRLEKIADDAWHGDGRDLKRNLVGVFADFDQALAALGSEVPEHMRRALTKDGEAG